MEDLQTKTPRKRVANFTTDEKAILAQLIKKRPIVESKITDGKSVAKKQAAWDLITQEFNCHANVYVTGKWQSPRDCKIPREIRETITLKRAWDNMKAFTRKARATERGDLLRTGGGPHAPPPSPQHGAIINMVEEAAPVMIREIKNAFDSDGAILHAIENTQTELIGTLDILDAEKTAENIFEVQDSHQTNETQIEEKKNSTDHTVINSEIKTRDQVRRPTDYIRREAVIRINLLETKKKMEIQILKTQLEVEQIKRKAALLEEERNKILLENAKIQLEELKKSIIKQSRPN